MMKKSDVVMKKLNLYILAIFMMAIPVLQSCDDDGHSLGAFTVRMATVRVVSGSTYTLEIDNGKKLWVAATDIPWYKPVDGQRTLANYTILDENYNEYDYAVKVNYLSNVLTKTVEELTEENEEEYGNDPTYIERMWIGGNYLNIQFRFFIPYNKAHRVSLVRNTMEDIFIDEEGYVHLEYRYNDQNDYSNYWRRSFVSYNLGEYGPERLADDSIIKGLKVKINSAVNGERVIDFDYKEAPVEPEMTYSSEIVNEGTN